MPDGQKMMDGYDDEIRSPISLIIKTLFLI
jgi:hypothetical protein